MKTQRPISVYKVFDAEAIALSANAVSVAIDLKEVAQNGFFSIHYTITGTGTAKIEYLSGINSDDTFIEPSGASDIGATLAAGSDWLEFTPIIAPMIKLKVTEDGGANAIGITLHLIIQ